MFRTKHRVVPFPIFELRQHKKSPDQGNTKWNDLLPLPHLSDLQGIPAKSSDIRSTKREKRVSFLETDVEGLNFGQPSTSHGALTFMKISEGERQQRVWGTLGLSIYYAVPINVEHAQTRETRRKVVVYS